MSFVHALGRLVDPTETVARPLLPLRRTWRQWLPVSAHIRERYLVTYRARAARLSELLPAPLAIDARDGFGFVSVCVLDIGGMGIAGTPSWLRFDNLEFLYRVGVRIGGAPSFFTLRSDVSAPALALLGRFSGYRPRRAEVTATRDRGRLRLVCRSADGRADADFEAAPVAAPPPPTSRFETVDDATRFLLGMRFSVDVGPGGRVAVQEIDHAPWQARFVEPLRRALPFVDDLARLIGTPLVYDHTLAMTDLEQTWRAARWI